MAVINQRVQAWQFTYPTEKDRQEHLAVQSAARFIRDHAPLFPGGRIPAHPAQLALLAIKAYEICVSSKESSDAEPAADIVKACQSFDSKIP